MPQNSYDPSRRTGLSLNLKTVTAAVLSALVFSGASAAGLGRLTVLSALGQPLQAEIELTSVAREEVGAISVKLASQEAFRQANIEFTPALLALRFAVEQRGGRQIVKVTSAQPLNEPFVDMLLELSGGNSRLVREYTFLLDPPVLRNGQSAQIASTPAPSAQPAPPAQSAPAGPQSSIGEIRPAPSARPVPEARPAAPRAAAPIPEAAPPALSRTRPQRPPAEPTAKASRASGDYKVKQGDTLAGIAGQFKPDGVSLDQMLVALQRANPDAFIGNNINRLRSGQILNVPDAQAAQAVSNSEARSVVVAQAADFNSYRNKLAGQVAGTTSPKADESRQSASGKITAKVQEQPSAASESKDKLQLSKSGIAPAPGSGKATPAGAEEDRIARERALAESNARVQALEKNVNDLQKLLEFKNKELADRQKAAGLKPEAAPTTAAASPASPASANAPAIPPVALATPAAANPPPATSPVAPSTTPSTATPAPESSQQAVASPAAAPVATDSKSAAVPANTAAPGTLPAVKKAVTPPPPPPEPSFVDDFLGNPTMMGLLAALVALLGGYGIYSARKKKQQQNFNESSMLNDSTLKTNSLFGSTGGQSVDTNNSVFNSNFAPSASQLDTNEVDPVAEADVYIAYGRDVQAEEILKEAMRTQPDRTAVRGKLLEIYASRKDTRAFETVATELYAMTKGEGEEWQQAATLGYGIDPTNPLYAGGRASESSVGAGGATLAGSSAAGAAASIDDLDLEALLNTTRGAAETEPDFSNSAIGTATLEDSSEKALSAADLNPATPAPASEGVMDFSLPSKPAVSVPVPESAHVAATKTADENLMDFDFDLELPGTKSTPGQVDLEDKAAALHDESVPELTLPEVAVPEINSVSNGLDFDFSKPASPPETVSAMNLNSPAGKDFSQEDFPLLQSGSPVVPAAPPSPQGTSTSMDFDLSGISLDLNPLDSAVTHAADGLDIGGADSNAAEMATKLDLALAYQEIGDREGARELLDEVVRGGSSEQADKARSLLEKLA